MSYKEIMENQYLAFGVVFSMFLFIHSKNKKTSFEWHILVYVGLCAFGEFYSLLGRHYWGIVPNTIVGFAIIILFDLISVNLTLGFPKEVRNFWKLS